MTPAANQPDILTSVRQWQTRLLQLDRRNALLFFPASKRGVTIRDVVLDTFLDEIASARQGLAFLYAERVRQQQDELFPDEEVTHTPEAEADIRVEPGDIETDLSPLDLQKRLAALRKRNREWQEEQGLNVLFLVLGFLRWTDEEQQPARSPILLAPCDLLCSSPRDPYRIVREDSDDPSVNPTLRHKLSAFAGITLPELGDESPSEYLQSVERLIANREGWSVEHAVVLAALPFSKLSMWEDLQRMASHGVTHPLVRRLAGDAEAALATPESGECAIPRDGRRLCGAVLDDLLDLRDQFTVVDADYSQLRAIELARSGVNMVIH